MRKHNVSFVCDQGLFKHLDKRSKELKITRSELVRLLLKADQQRTEQMPENSSQK